MLVSDADGLYDDIVDDGILESLVILGLCAALLFLIWYRQQRQQPHRREAVGVLNRGAAAPAQQGLFPQPGDPEFAQWAPGGVGH